MFKTRTTKKSQTPPQPGARGAPTARPPRPPRPRAVLAAGKSQRRTVRIALLLSTGLIGIAGGAIMLHRSGGTVPVYVAVRAVPSGAIILKADLGVQQVPRPGVAGALALAGILGRRAAVPILPGEILTAGLASAGGVPVSQAVVGASIAAGHMPGAGVATGSRVEIVYTGQQPLNGAAGAPASVAPGTVLCTAAVSSEIPSATGGNAQVDLIVPVAKVSVVTTAAAAGNISLARIA